MASQSVSASIAGFLLVSVPINGNAEDFILDSIGRKLSAVGATSKGFLLKTQDNSDRPAKLALWSLSNIQVDVAGIIASFSSSEQQPTYTLYRQLSERSRANLDDKPPGISLIVSMQPGEQLSEQEFHDWYEQEHIPLFTKIPGWRWTRRGELVEGSSDLIARFVAIHGWDSMDSFATDEYKHAISTDWRTRVIIMIDLATRVRMMLDFVRESGN